MTTTTSVTDPALKRNSSDDSDETAGLSSSDEEQGVVNEATGLLVKNKRSNNSAEQDTMSVWELFVFLWTNVVNKPKHRDDVVIQSTLLDPTRLGTESVIPEDAYGPFVTISILAIILVTGWFTATWFLAEKFYSDDSTWLLNGFIYGLIGFGYNKLLHSIKIPIKLTWFRSMGLTWHSTALACGPRDLWTSETVDAYLEVYGKNRIKIVDAVSRRFGHVLDHAFRDMFWTPFVVTTQVERIVCIGVLYSFKLIDKGIFLQRNNLLASAAYQGARIRDGRLGRINLLSVIISGGALYPLCMMVLWVGMHRRLEGNEESFAWLVAYVSQATAWGDTFAELIGSFFGRLEFKVYGFGEVNRKSIEGCMACFVASFVSCMVWTMPDGFPRDIFHVNLTTLSFFVALAGTIVETISFRGTDNGLMTLASVLVVIACSHNI